MIAFSDLLTGPFVPDPVSSTTDRSVSNTVNRPLVGGLKIYCSNINYLPKHVDELRIMVEEFSPRIICLNETKLNIDSEMMN